MGKSITKIINEWLDPLLCVIYPNLCEVCGRTLVPGETVFCTHCYLSMPRYNHFHDPFNEIHRRLFSSYSHMDHAGALYAYHRHDVYAKVIHKMKYGNRPDIGEKLGRIIAREADAVGFFTGVDLLLPVPMHWWKELHRGYNQSKEIALGIKSVTGIPVGKNLKSGFKQDTQTKKNAKMRWKNTEGIYSVKHPEQLEGKHVMLIDDVITTGATLLHCVEALTQSVNDIKVSACAIAATKLD